MTIEERKERFSKFNKCGGTICEECVYHTQGRRFCADIIAEDAQAIMKDMADKYLGDKIETIVEENKPPVYKSPLTMAELEEVKEIINERTTYEDMSYHLIQEINELCAELNHLAAAIGRYEQIQKGTDPVGKDIDRGALCKEIENDIKAVIREAVDVRNYICLSGYESELAGWFEKCEEKLARWANRLNGVSEE